MWYKYKKYIEENEEIRCWFKVSSNRKKVWNIQLGLIEEVKRICKKHGLKYYADSWTLLWAIRHKWFIPWDDDVDLAMFREDYDKFLQIAKNELPDYIKLWKDPGCFYKLINVNTTALWITNWQDEDFIWWIRIDIFPIDNASRFKSINRVKSWCLRFISIILYSQKSYDYTVNKSKFKSLRSIIKFVFKKIDCSKLYQIHEKISKKAFFKWSDIYFVWNPYMFFPKYIFDTSYDVVFENTTIPIPTWYNEYLRILFGDYMIPVSYWWHECRYSVEKSYKEIIKMFDKSKSDKYNFTTCKSLFKL